MKNLYSCILFLILIFTGCSKDDPEEVHFVDLQSLSHSCRVNYFNDSSLIINNQTDYDECIRCIEDTPPEIDFNEYTLVIAGGTTTSQPVTAIPSLSKNSKNKYILTVELSIGIATSPGSWSVGLIIPKIKDSTKVVLEIVEAKHDI